MCKKTLILGKILAAVMFYFWKISLGIEHSFKRMIDTHIPPGAHIFILFKINM